MTDDALPDVNVLIALTWPQHLHHRVARRWLRAHDGRFLTTPFTEAALVRLSLNRSVVGSDVTPRAALTVLQRLRALPGHAFLPDDSSLATPRIELARYSTSRQTTDLHLVNLCATHGLTLVTLDRGIVEMLEPEDRRWVRLLDAAEA